MFELEYRDVSYSNIVHSISGKITSGKIQCIVGKSGAGKSTFLDILGGHKKNYQAKIVLNNHEIDSLENHCNISYVIQDYFFNGNITVEETIRYYYKLTNNTLNPNMNPDVIINKLLKDFDLFKIKNNFIDKYGKKSDNKSSISGGEKKKLAIICGLIRKPDILIIDEITSGLDSHNAHLVVNYLKNYCFENNIIGIFSIHQPNNETLQLFDELVIIDRGYSIYSDNVINWLNWFNTDDLPVIESLENLLCHVNKFDESQLIRLNNQVNISLQNRQTVIISYEYNYRPTKPSELVKFNVLLKRGIMTYTNNINILLIRVFASIVVGIIETLVLGSGEFVLKNLVKTSPNTIDSLIALVRITAFFMFKIFSVTIFPLKALSLFFDNKQVYEFELRSKLYKPATYFFSNLLLETTIQTLTSIVYSIITWIPTSMNYINFFIMYTLIVVLETNISNLLIQLFSLLTNDRDSTLIIFTAYLSLSFIVIIGSNMIIPFNKYYDIIRIILQSISLLKYPLNILLLEIKNYYDPKSIDFLLDYTFNPHNSFFNKLNISNNFTIYIMMYVVLLIIAFIKIY